MAKMEKQVKADFSGVKPDFCVMKNPTSNDQSDGRQMKE